MRMSIQNLTNGIILLVCAGNVAFTEKMVSQPVYTIRYYEHNLQYSAGQVLSDSYTMYCGQLLKQELVIAGCAALLIAFLATLAVYWYLGRAGRANRVRMKLSGPGTLRIAKRSCPDDEKTRGSIRYSYR